MEGKTEMDGGKERNRGTGVAEVDATWCPASRIENPIDKVDIRGHDWSVPIEDN